jgi:hypothetical protein
MMHIDRRYLILQAVIIIGIFSLAEIYVRHDGHGPGDLRPNWSNFHPVDSLIVYDDFIVDSTGILVAKLLIGDSFTWGLSAKPLDSCFADLLKSMLQDTVINMGIPIADPAQYAAIARRYIPIVHPDKVIIMFYLGNDIMPMPRQIIPYRPFYYYTNAGAMMADDGDIHLNNAREAYNYYTRQKFFLIHPVGICEKIIAQSALLSRIYSLKYRWEEKRKAEQAISDMSVTQRYLYSIVNVCKQYNCSLQIILIPEIKEADKPVTFFEKRYKGFFKDSILAHYTYIPDGNSPQNYVPYPDGHLNNAGHKFYAYKIAERIKYMDKKR